MCVRANFAEKNFFLWECVTEVCETRLWNLTTLPLSQQFLHFDTIVQRKDWAKPLPKQAVRSLSILVKKHLHYMYITQHCNIDTLDLPLQIKKHLSWEPGAKRKSTNTGWRWDLIWLKTTRESEKMLCDDRTNWLLRGQDIDDSSCCSGTLRHARSFVCPITGGSTLLRINTCNSRCLDLKSIDADIDAVSNNREFAIW